MMGLSGDPSPHQKLDNKLQMWGVITRPHITDISQNVRMIRISQRSNKRREGDLCGVYFVVVSILSTLEIIVHRGPVY